MSDNQKEEKPAGDAADTPLEEVGFTDTVSMASYRPDPRAVSDALYGNPKIARPNFY